MENNKDVVTDYIEPIFRFCLKRLKCREDAKDLAQEILVYILYGLSKYEIQNLEGWIWQVAHNRYAKFIDAKAKSESYQNLAEFVDYDYLDCLIVKEEHQNVFQALHSLSAMYRNIMVEYYLLELSIKTIAAKNNLPLSTVKWRLHVGREQIKERMDKMPRIYNRINWNTTTCNGSMDANRYLYSQLARAICLAAYEKPLTCEEISLITGIPTLYIEDELPRLLYGDALIQKGDSYLTDFIILKLADQKALFAMFSPYIAILVEKIAPFLADNKEAVKNIGFYGCDFGMEKLGYIIVPLIIRQAVSHIQNAHEKLQYGPFIPRKDGSYGWFIVKETEDEKEGLEPFAAGNNSYMDPSEPKRGQFVYLWLGKYFDNELYRQGIGSMFSQGLLQQTENGILIKETISDDDLARLIRLNLVKKEKGYKLAIPIFTKEQFEELINPFSPLVNDLEALLTELVFLLWKEFTGFVPKHLYGQINQYLAGYVHNIIGLVISKMIADGFLSTPPKEGPLSYNVFYLKTPLGYNI